MTRHEVHAIACNYAEATNIARKGARAYLLWRTGGDAERCNVLVKSRSGRWVDKWESIHRLDKFRVVMVRPGAFEYKRIGEWYVESPSDIAEKLQDIVACHVVALGKR